MSIVINSKLRPVAQFKLFEQFGDVISHSTLAEIYFSGYLLVVHSLCNKLDKFGLLFAQTVSCVVKVLSRAEERRDCLLYTSPSPRDCS